MDQVERVRLSVDESLSDFSSSFPFSTDSSTLVLLKSFCDSPSPDSALASDNDRNHDQHSSEEELEVINRDAPASTCQSSSSSVYHPEKRKWSQANRLSFGGDSSASSDDEVRELMCCSRAPLQFCTSPPANAHKPSQSASPPAKLFHFASSLSPRKKHRQQQSTATPATSSNSTTPTPRPCLDFEKMQQLRTRAVSAWRPSREVSLIC